MRGRWVAGAGGGAVGGAGDDRVQGAAQAHLRAGADPQGEPPHTPSHLRLAPRRPGAPLAGPVRPGPGVDGPSAARRAGHTPPCADRGADGGSPPTRGSASAAGSRASRGEEGGSCCLCPKGKFEPGPRVLRVPLARQIGRRGGRPACCGGSGTAAGQDCSKTRRTGCEPALGTVVGSMRGGRAPILGR